MAPLKGTLALLHIVLNTLVWCVPIYLLAIPRYLLFAPEQRAAIAALMGRCADGWVACNRVMLRALRLVRIDASWQLDEPLDRNRWYLVISNHQSWSDILVLQDTFLRRIPPLKFFNKRPLLWVPLIGFAMWLLDFPYVRRYPREVLERNPALRRHDQEATAKACAQFSARPTSVLNFLEGTRFTVSKHQHQRSPFRHLLMPKTGGFGIVRASLGERIHQVLDVTIVYPGGTPSFWQFLCGRCSTVRIEIATVATPVLGSDALAADGLPTELRNGLREWTDDLWRRKDARIDEIMAAR
jgi:1-acyl-sn-glycerol-3-phosphate acyltransferase